MKSLYTILFCLLMVSLNAQDYTFMTSTGTYTELVDAASPHGDQTWDEEIYVWTFDPSFTFTFFGKEYTEVGQSVNGTLIFLNTANDVRSQMTFDSDLCDRAFDVVNDEPGPGSLSTISTKREMVGTENVLKVEYKNAGFYSDIDVNTVSTDFINLQLWLYFESGKVEFHFGPSTILSPTISYNNSNDGPTIKLRSNIDDDTDDAEQEIWIKGSPSNPTMEFGDDLNALGGLDGNVADGTIYTFTPANSTSTTDLLNQNSVRVFPNPATEVLNISTSTTDLKMENYTILNPQGQELTRAAVRSNQINIAHLVTGMYILKLETSEGVVSKKFFVL